MNYDNLYGDIAIEGTGVIDKIVYVAREFYIKIKHLLKRMIYNINRVRFIKIPKEVDMNIRVVINKCSMMWSNAEETKVYDLSVLNELFKSREYINVFHNVNKDNYFDDEYMKVPTKGVVDKMKEFDRLIERAELELHQASKINDPVEVAKLREKVTFQQKVGTTMLVTLKQYFDFGRVTKGNAVIPLGETIDATPDLII